MSNTIVTIDMITREAQRIAHEKLSFLGTVDRQYDSSFAKTGAKIGQTLRVREANQYTRRTGSRVMDVQDQAESNKSFTVATQDGVDMRFNSAELAMSLDYISERYIEPAVSVLVAGIEGDVLTDCTKKTYQLTGTAGSVVGASGELAALFNARAKINQQCAPKDGGNRFVQFDSVTMGSVANGIKNLFTDQSQIKEAFREGFIARSAMADFYENEKTWSLTNGSDVTDVTLDTYTIIDGDSTITVTGATGVAEGAIFTINGVYDCHPETKQAYSHLKQFTVLSGSTDTALVISPTIRITGAKKNVCAATGADITPASLTTAALVFHGAANTTYRQNLMYHKDAFAFVTADLPLMDDAHKCVRRVQDGLSMRVWQASDIRNDELLMRIDILYGWLVARPEWAARISN
jgi:hypothetical protein